MKPAWLLSEYLHLLQFDMHKAMMIRKLKTISPSIKGRWLDIGAGDQPYKIFFSGTEEYLTTNTKRHYKGNDLEKIEKRTSYWIEDGKSLPMPDNSLDGVACFQVLSVIDKPEAFFKEIQRVLKPGGKLILTTDFIYPVWSDEDRYRHTAYNLEQLAITNGFHKTTIESFGGFASTAYALFMRYMRSFPEIWKRKKVFTKAVFAALYVMLLLMLPFISIIGVTIFGMEKNSKHNTDFTFNILLTSEKKSY
jgi:SAM-dependent methyltransferase